MEPEFWHGKWERGEIGFHQSEVNHLLIGYLPTLSLSDNSRILVPLCGKTLDISWLLNQGYKVIGVELSETAIEQLFDELEIKPTITNTRNLKHYTSDKLEVFVGDIFEISQEMLGSIDLIYDRAALVALPLTMRKAYATKLIEISNRAPQLVICFEYDQSIMEGPPFSINRKEIEQHYKNSYQINLLESSIMSDKLKDKVLAKEAIWHLQ